MLTINTDRTLQMELDLETDNERRDRRDWQRAIDGNLHALRDYVDPHQLLIWRPGERKRGPKSGHTRTFDVQLTTSTNCTCSRFKLRDRCEHMAFVKQLEATGMMPDTDTPVRAGDVQGNEEAA